MHVMMFYQRVLNVITVENVFWPPISTCPLPSNLTFYNKIHFIRL